MTPAARRRAGSGAGPLVLTLGEPAGIGAEIALKAWLAAGERASPDETPPPFVLIDAPERLAELAERLGLAVPVAAVEHPAEAAARFREALPVLPIALPVPVDYGRPDPANGPAVIEAIERAVTLVRDGRAAAVVTNPIHKGVLYGVGFRHPGHTEFLAELAGCAEPPVMMLATPELRVVPVTIHEPLARVPERLTRAAIRHAGLVTATALQRDFGIARPRLVVAGLNPHAGEGGALGREEIEVIGPAVESLKQDGLAVEGPLPADTLFHPAARRSYDAALCMYHDQALIPLKTIDLEHGVNITLGLPFVRTSPDHGTALGIAGRGEADPSSLIAALVTAGRMAAMRAAAARDAGA